MKRKYSYLLFLSLFVFLLTVVVGCGGNDEADSTAEYDMASKEASYSDDNDGGFNEVAEDGAYDEQETAGRTVTDSSGQLDNESTMAQQTERMVIYNADMSIEVKDYHKTQNEILAKAQQIGGFVVQSSLHNSGTDEIFGNLVVRVPQVNFHSFLNDLESYSTKVIDRSISGNDVTEEFVDIESRLRSKRTVEERLLSFMDGADNTENLLKISNDLAKVQEEIEQLTGRMNYLENNVSFSTISVYIHERKVTVPPIQDSDSLNTWKNAQSLFMDTVNVMITLFSRIVIFFIGLSPILIPIGFIAGATYITLKRKQRKKDDVSE